MTFKLKLHGRGAGALWPRMPCSSLCGFTTEMRRPHISCIWCRQRRFAMGKMDPDKYHTNRYIAGGRIVIPTNKKEYVLFLNPPISGMYMLVADENRRFLQVKKLLLERLVSWIQKLAEKQVGPEYAWLKRLAIKYGCTFAEGLVN